MNQAFGSVGMLLWCLLTCTIIAGSLNPVNAQSQALNGQIEGVVTDSVGAAIPNAAITIRNIGTGTERQLTSDENGVYRAPLLPLGTYRVTVESANFKRLVRDGITLTTGQTATVDLSLETGDVSATVNVTSDAPIADAAKIDVGRVMNAREVQNLPLVSRNPYNYALLQANVTGRPNAEFGVPRINANGYTRRTNYQLDGNNNTQADRAGIRLMPISETFISEVQLVTNGFSAEFGNTPGLIFNAVTPSGTNGIHGSVSYRFRRTAFSSRPFNISPTALKPKTNVDNFTFAVGGPIIKDRWHYYGGYEYVKRGLAGEPQRIITINESDKARLIALGVPASAFPTAIPTAQKVNFYIFRTDAQLNDANRLSGRYNYFKNLSPDNIAGQLNTLQRSIDFNDVSKSVGIQLASIFSTDVLNEFRFQFASRDSRNLANANSGTGPSIVIAGIASFGAPEDDDTIAPLEKTTQFQDNLTLTKGNHAVKVGGGLIRIANTRRSNVFTRYTFSSIDRYRDALNAPAGSLARRGYVSYLEAFGNPNIQYKSTFYNFFAQDDWKVTRRLKFNYGLRYDLYQIPDADRTSPFAASQNFKVDKNNFAPRLGVVYGLREGRLPTVVRASAGIYYDTPFTDLYRRALISNGNPSYFTLGFNGNNGGTVVGSPSAPDFGTTLGSLPAGTVVLPRSIETVASDFKTLYAIHSNAQIEQALTENLSLTAGLIHSSGRHIPVYRNINRINPVRFLADGRPVYSNIVSATTRVDPRFDNILIAESVGNSNYNALTLQLSKRFSQGYQFSANYTFSKALDDAPEQNVVATQVGNLVSQDPTNRRRDFGPSLADQRHTFVMSFVGRPTFDFDNKVLNYITNKNQIGFIATANSGERFNIVTAGDLNLDGSSGSDNPVGIGRNSGKTPKQFNVDVRYSRFINFTERFSVEAFAEAVNIFNTNSIFQINSLTVLTTDTLGNAISPLPTAKTRAVTSLDSRQAQFGLKFIF